MRCLKRNEQDFWYSLYTETVNPDGEPYNAYSEPVKASACISGATGFTAAAMFGTSEGYDKIIVIDDVDFPVDENSVLWVDKLPEYDLHDNPIAWDYIVKRVSKHLDSIGIAIKRVDVE